MNWLEFTLGLINALAWPVVVFTLALIFKEKIGVLFQAIRRIKLGQLEAEVDRVREEAAATITQLRELALAFAVPAAHSLPGTISSSEYAFSLYTASLSDRMNQAQSIVDALVELGVERSKAEEIILSPMQEHVRRAHVSWICNAVDIALASDDSVEPSMRDNPLLRKSQDLPVLDRLKNNEVTLAETRAALTEHFDNGNLPEEVRERLVDLEHFDATGSLRRPDVAPWNED